MGGCACANAHPPIHTIHGTHFSHPQLSSDFKSVTSSQTTTENEDNSEGDENQAVRIKPLPMDPLLLQALSLEANKTLVEEEEALGKVCV